MGGRGRLLGSLLIPAMMAAFCAAMLYFRPVDVLSSIYDLAGDAADSIPAVVRNHSERLVPVLVSARDGAAARGAADRVFSRLPVDGCSGVRYRFDGGQFSETVEMCRRRRSGLVSPGDAELLKTPEGRSRIAKAAARRHFSSPVPSLFSPADDPFFLTDRFVTSLSVSFSGWRPADNVLCAERDGRHYVLIVLELAPSVAGDTDKLIAFSRSLDAAVSDIVSDTVRVDFCGMPLHTAKAADRCKNEIGALTWFSLAFIAVLSVCVFRSVRWIPLLALSLAVSALSGLLAVSTVFSSIHMMTLVFGTTVLGLVIDYSFHWLLQRRGTHGETVRNLLLSAATTEISLVPLMVSPNLMLQQSAVFLAAGLAAAIGYVLTCYPLPSADDAPAASGELVRTFPVRVLAAMTVAVAAFGWGGLSFNTGISDLYRPPDELAAAERTFAELSGTDDLTRGFVVTAGADSLEELLRKEESLGLPDDVPRLSRFLPSLESRRSHAADVEKLYREHGGRLSSLLGIQKLQAPPAPDAWRWEDVPASAEAAFVRSRQLVVASSPRPVSPLPEGCVFCQPGRMLEEMLSRWDSEIRSSLLGTLGLMLVSLAAFFRLRAVRIITPSLLAIFSALGIVGLTGGSVTVFHLLACFLLAGMGVDYTVFLHSGRRDAFKSAFCSLLTSVAGFGALSFVSFPVVSAFGLVLGTGLPVAFMSAYATVPRAVPSTEHGASPIGLEALFLVYRVFGLRVLHGLAASVGLAMWTFSREVRKASPSPKKIVAFAHSLADKIVVMAEGRRHARIAIDGHPDTLAFLEDVAAKKGVFVLSSHCGTVEMLAALGECNVVFHAWMEFSRTSVFNSFYLRHAKRGKVKIYPVSSFGPETVFWAADALDSGDCMVMAGDRGFGRMRTIKFRDGDIQIPEGAFRFALALGHPVYFAACVSTGSCRYLAMARRLPDSGVDELQRAYVACLDEVTRGYPKQWFRWEGH